MMTRKSRLAALGLTALGILASAGAVAESRNVIDAGVTDALTQFYAHSPKDRELADKAAGMLVFPSITKGGVGVAGEYGEGVLQVHGKTVGYYKVGGASIGLTLGVAKRSEVIMFMTQEALDKFTQSKGWTVGVDAGVAVVSRGAGGEYDSKTLQKPILGFVYNEKGLIGDLSLKGSKISKLD